MHIHKTTHGNFLPADFEIDTLLELPNKANEKRHDYCQPTWTRSGLKADILKISESARHHLAATSIVTAEWI